MDPRSDPKLIKSEMGEHFYNYVSVRALACAVDAVFYPLPDQQGTLTMSEMVKTSVTSLRRTGDESVYGYALLGGIKNTTDLFVLKVSRDREDDSDIAHEFFVGVKAINNLRRAGIPNFAVIYGAFRCSKPVIDSATGQVLDFCSDNVTDNDKIPYVIYENISPSISADSYARTGTKRQILSMILQVYLALEIAGENFGISHQDLHNKNVLMRDVVPEKYFQIPYERPSGKKVYVVWRTR